MYILDAHIHSISSGHGSKNTINEISLSAHKKGLQLIGITDHAPSYIGSAKESYFLSLDCMPKKRFGIDVLYGVELNILDFNGMIDLKKSTLDKLDYAIVSMHKVCIKSGNIEQNTFGYINAIKQNSKIKIIGHCDDVNYPVDFHALLLACMYYNVVFEINNASLSPNSYRKNSKDNIIKMLKICKKYNYPVILSSDSHSSDDVGCFDYAQQIINNLNFPSDLILNISKQKFLKFIHGK